MKRACLFRSLCNNPVKKKQEPENLQKEWENVYFLLGKKKQPPETEHSVPEIIKPLENQANLLNGPARETALLQHPPVGHKRIDKNPL